jgi:hypothetical protein
MINGWDASASDLVAGEQMPYLMPKILGHA